MIGDDEAKKNDGTDADQRLQSVRIERLLRQHIYHIDFHLHALSFRRCINHPFQRQLFQTAGV